MEQIRRNIIKFTSYALCVIYAYSCSGGSIIGNNEPSGKAGDLLIVINDEYKNDEISSQIIDILNQYEIGLTQNESPFNILLISKNHFSSIFRTHRNILYLDIQKKYTTPKLQFKKNIWADKQNYLAITAKSTKDLLQIIQQRHNNILDYFIKSEISRYISTFEESPNTIIQSTVLSKFNCNIKVPSGFVINKQSEDFIWFSYEAKDYSQGIILYKRPYTDTLQLEKSSLLNYRDSILHIYIPGPSKGSYMTTEYLLPTQEKIGRYVANNYTVELRGKWRVENDFMGGPFIQYTFVNSRTKQLITIEGYVYYPNKNKRNLMRQLEAICQSITVQ